MGIKLASMLIFLVSAAHASGDILAEGKTKIVWSYPDDSSLAIIESKDDITAGNGARHDVIQGKAELATRTTCNVFRLLADCGMPVAFRKQLDPLKFLATLCQMIPYEVIVRREAHGSYLKRYPSFKKGDIFPTLVVEFFLKTSNKVWMGIPIPKDDPFIQFTDAGAELFLPDAPIDSQTPFMTLSDFPLKGQPELFEQIALMAKQTFLILEKAWQLENGRLVDFKVEFGIDSYGKLLLADVIDNDSWRVIHNQQYIDKQVYRDGGTVDKVAALYRQVSHMTDHFKLPEQQLIFLNGSGLEEQFKLFANDHLKSVQMNCSNLDYLSLRETIKAAPDCVLIASECQGEVSSLLANVTIPVIATAELQDAVPAALRILAVRNPLLYMQLRLQQEEGLTKNLFEKNLDRAPSALCRDGIIN